MSRRISGGQGRRGIYTEERDKSAETDICKDREAKTDRKRKM